MCGDRLGKRVSVVKSIGEGMSKGMLCGFPSPRARAHTACDYAAQGWSSLPLRKRVIQAGSAVRLGDCYGSAAQQASGERRIENVQPKADSDTVGVDLLVKPPSPNSPSYPLYLEETSTTHDNLKSRSSLMADRFNALEGMSCQPAEGAMYLFPSIEMPKRAVEEAEKRGKKADVMYALDLLGAFFFSVTSLRVCNAT